MNLSPRRAAVWCVVAAVALGVVAAASPAPDRITDRQIYENTADRFIVADCSDLHCFRVLVPWILGRVPAPATVTWKAYAAVSNAVAAVAVVELSDAFGLSAVAATFAGVLTASGFGALYTLHDPFTSDPLMFALGPILTLILLRGRVAAAGVVACIGVLAKEFAAAPVYVFAGASVALREFRRALAVLVAANSAFIVWLVFTLTMILAFNYSYGGSDSIKIGSGAVLAEWLRKMSSRGAAAAMFNEFGPLYVLAPVGLWMAPRRVRALAAAAAPVAAVLVYVQQPDRALWNFHYIVTPAAAVVLANAGQPLAWAVVALFAIGNLKVGAQLAALPAARYALGGAAVLALAATASVLRQRPVAA